MADIITELYNNIRWKDLMVGKWRGNVLKSIMEKSKVFLDHKDQKREGI